MDTKHLNPEEQVARRFMTHKGYPDVEPFEIERLDDQDCWYFVYHLPEGILELEVSWQDDEWDARVSIFTRD